MERAALVTGAAGEMGHLLIPTLRQRGWRVAALDLAALPEEMKAACAESVEASILDVEAIRGLVRRHKPALVLHLAALLSRKSEAEPELAHRVNVDGTLGLLRLVQEELPAGVRLLFPSSIAIYGLPDAETKRRQGAVRETEWTVPAGMYGCNKLYCELLGAYTTRRSGGKLDFRAIRFPGLISSDTLPSGGTTDYAPEMIHAAAQGKPYTCFVADTARLPFMTMPDAVEAAVLLAEADPARLSTRIYNIKGFSASAGDFRAEVLRHYPEARIDFRVDPARQQIVDSWPEDVDDALARRDWKLTPRHGLTEAFRDYLVPALRERYRAGRLTPH
ncbi:MAG TPA: NAD-dependent epimerase/dehydratase family protein [Candidatus Polarisedimenticolaceae bacterium]|nr:NAD-dependent epimerase/dehydratase family protein [Candidatus Polarisedimenticolaceae bacterium]